ncbi:MAG: hypothetical protein ACE5OY_04500 [Candidatus Bathyarchaeia archaeon]
MIKLLARFRRDLTASQLLEEALLIGISLCIAAGIFALASKMTGQLGTSLGEVWRSITKVFSDYFGWLH